MTIGSLEHVAAAVSLLIDVPFNHGEQLNVRKLTGSDNIDRLIFVMVTKDRKEGHYSYIIDQASLTTYIGVDRHRTGCFVFNKGLWDLLENEYYKYWFAVVNNQLLRVRRVSVHQLFKAINIKLTKSNTDFLTRDIEYPAINVKQPYLPGRPGINQSEAIDMIKAVIATARIRGRQTNITLGDAMKYLGREMSVGELEAFVKRRAAEVKELGSVEEFFETAPEKSTGSAADKSPRSPVASV